jgi:hypothetical protein
MAVPVLGSSAISHRGGRGEPDGLADLPDARRIALLPGLRVDELEHLPLPGGEPGGARIDDVGDADGVGGRAGLGV